MTTKYRKVLVVAAVATLGLLMIAPTQASTNGNGPTYASLETMGTIHVVNVVLNDNKGTLMPADFQMAVKHFGGNVQGSPFAAVAGSGVTFVLEPGTYVVSQEAVDGYSGTWSGDEITNGFIYLHARQEVTITRTIIDDGVGNVVANEPVTDEPVTETGGTLPATATPWFNALVVALLIVAAGVVGMRRSVVLRNRRG